VKQTSVVIVECNTDLRHALRHAFEDRGYVTWTFPNPEIAFSIFTTIQPNVIVMDLDVPGVQSYEAIDACRKLCPNASLIVESTSFDHVREQEALNHGAQAFLVKRSGLPPLFAFFDKFFPSEASEKRQRLKAA
jgi:CheY-like chemotaxis protein